VSGKWTDEHLTRSKFWIALLATTLRKKPKLRIAFTRLSFRSFLLFFFHACSVFVALPSLARSLVRSLARSVALAISLSAINNNKSLQRITAIHGGRDQRCSFTQPQQQGNTLHTLKRIGCMWH
jgi:hypothetical protein